MAKYQKFECPGKTGEYLFCWTHEYVFLESHCCPLCKPPARTIYDEWTPSDEQMGLVKLDAVPLLNAEFSLPEEGEYRIGVCSLHNMKYIEGISKCPECVVLNAIR